MKPHKHAEFIKAWADGYDIQHRWKSTKTGEWTEWQDCEWHDVEFFYDNEYRIKPKPKPDVVKSYAVAYGGAIYEVFKHDSSNLKITFDGETGELKSAEVLK